MKPGWSPRLCFPCNFSSRRNFAYLNHLSLSGQRGGSFLVLHCCFQDVSPGKTSCFCEGHLSCWTALNPSSCCHLLLPLILSLYAQIFFFIPTLLSTCSDSDTQWILSCLTTSPWLEVFSISHRPCPCQGLHHPHHLSDHHRQTFQLIAPFLQFCDHFLLYYLSSQQPATPALFPLALRKSLP